MRHRHLWVARVPAGQVWCSPGQTHRPLGRRSAHAILDVARLAPQRRSLAMQRRLSIPRPSRQIQAAALIRRTPPLSPFRTGGACRPSKAAVPESRVQQGRRLDLQGTHQQSSVTWNRFPGCCTFGGRTVPRRWEFAPTTYRQPCFHLHNWQAPQREVGPKAKQQGSYRNYSGGVARWVGVSALVRAVSGRPLV